MNVKYLADHPILFALKKYILTIQSIFTAANKEDSGPGLGVAL